MLQETLEAGQTDPAPWDATNEQGLYALLALVGTRRLDIVALCERIRLAPPSFRAMMKVLQGEHLVDLVSSLEGGRIHVSATLTEKGEALLVSCSSAPASSQSCTELGSPQIDCGSATERSMAISAMSEPYSAVLRMLSSISFVEATWAPLIRGAKTSPLIFSSV